MKTHFALLRGINVGGNTRVAMSELTGLFEELGCTRVKTYIQSGNVVFCHATATPDRLATELTAKLSKKYGFAPSVLVLTERELASAASANPFKAAEDDPRSVHLFFLAERPKNPDRTALEALRTKTERFAIKDKVLYLHTPDGFGRSKLAQRAERLLGVMATARNWRTVTTLVEMARSG